MFIVRFCFSTNTYSFLLSFVSFEPHEDCRSDKVVQTRALDRRTSVQHFRHYVLRILLASVIFNEKFDMRFS